MVGTERIPNRPAEAACPPPITRQYPKGQSVNATSSNGVPMCRLLQARETIPPSPLTPAGIPVAKTTPGCHTRLRIGVTASWHGQQSTSPTLWDYPSPKGLVVRRLDCKPETPTARDSSAFTRRRMSTDPSSALGCGLRRCRRCRRAPGRASWLVSCRRRQRQSDWASTAETTRPHR